MNPKSETITLIGAGLNGPLLAIGLVKRGFKVEIYERRPDMRRVRVSAGRSINLALSTRGIHALTQAGLWERDAKHHHSHEGTDDALGHCPNLHFSLMGRMRLK